MVRAVTFTDEASEEMYVFQEQMQERLRRGGDLHPMASWASKLPGKLARIAALITLYEDPTPRTSRPRSCGPRSPWPRTSSPTPGSAWT
jgi:hypothetical protein